MAKQLQLFDPLTQLHDEFRACRKCADMIPPVVLGKPRVSEVMLIGQAPGPREGKIGHPFGWTAGTTLFRWIGSLGVDEATFRDRAYIAAVCRCFPGKASGGSASKGDRVPSTVEISNCRGWMQREIDLVRPKLLLPVGRLAIEQVLGRKEKTLTSVIGVVHRVRFLGAEVDAIPLPHPSGLSAWHKVEPGKSLLVQALDLVKAHDAWRAVFEMKTPLSR